MPGAPPACEHCGEAHEGRERFCPVTGRPMVSRLLPPGTILERKYRIERTVGVGGMGAVFEATHLLLDKRVAIKVILPSRAAGDQLAPRLLREARAAAATGHRNIAAVTDLGAAPEGSHYVVMEYLEGRTLREVVDEEGPLAPERAAAILDQLLAGLDAVHRRGIVHRDLKPENVMVVLEEDAGEVVKILDFGISKMEDGDVGLTSEGLVIGTPQYMAPEQIRSAHHVDGRADLYAAGALLYFLLTGCAPIAGKTAGELLAAALDGAVEPPSRKRRELPAELDEVVLTAMSKAPEDRFSDAQSFRVALQASLDPLPDDWESGGLLTGGPDPQRPRNPPPPEPAPPEWDESSLVALDEVEAATVSLLPAPATARPEPPSSPSPVEPEPEPAPPEPAPTEPAAAPAPHEHRAAGHGAIYGQARRRPPARVGLWVALAVVTIGAGLYWLVDVEGPGQAARPQVRVRFAVRPGWATVRVDGTPVSAHWVVLERGDREHTVEVTAEGHISRIERFRADADQELSIQLLEAPPSPDAGPQRPARLPRKRRRGPR